MSNAVKYKKRNHLHTVEHVEDFLSFLPNMGMAAMLVGWLFWVLTALLDSISVYIGPSPKEREKEERKDR